MPIIQRMFAALLLVAAISAAGAASAQPVPTVAAPAEAGAPAGPALSSAEAARALIGILDDEAARSRLIGELGRIAAGGTDTSPADPAAPVDDAATTGAQTNLGQELGIYTQGMLRDVVDVTRRVWLRLANLGDIVTGEARIDWQRLKDQLGALAVVAGVGYGVLFAARLAMRWPRRRLDEAAAGRGPVLRLALLLLAVNLEIICLAIAWAATLAAVGSMAAAGDGRPGLVESIFTNAFVLIEGIKSAFRLGFSPRHPGLRLLPMTGETAGYWSVRLQRLTELLGYGILLLVPIVNTTVSFAVGLGVRIAVVLVVLALWLMLLARNRRRVRAGLNEAAARTTSVALTTILSLVAPVWHVALGAYALVAFVVWITRPLDAIGFMVTATLQSAATVAIGGGLMALVSRAIQGGVSLPADMKATLPLLEDRLNLLVPSFLKVLRIVMGVAIVAGIAEAWDLVDVFSWARTEEGSKAIGHVAMALVIVVAAMAVWIAATSWIEYRLHPTAGKTTTPRVRTLLALFRNAFTIVLVVIASMLALSELGVDIAPLIAGAGVLGLAIGFGSQKLVQDIINGAFIQFENAMNEGDVVTVAGVSGVVERLTIRSVGLRDGSGVYHIIPFSSVDSVSNAMRGFAFHVAELRIPRDENIDDVKRLMQEAFDRLLATPHQSSILEPLDMQGIVDFADGAVVVRARIKTLPGQQWGVGRAYSEIVKTVFNDNGISLPAAPPDLLVESAAMTHPSRRRAERVETARGEEGVRDDGEG